MHLIKNKDDYKDVTLEAVELYNKKDYKNALIKFKRLEKCNYKNPKIHEMLVYIYLILKNLPMAEKEYENYLELMKKDNPGLVHPRSFEEIVQEAGNIKDLENRYKKIISRKIKKFDPIKQSEVPLNLGFLYMSQGRYQKAEEVLVKYKEAYMV
jgi:tetratricopeptide (TPR) repeat protein